MLLIGLALLFICALHELWFTHVNNLHGILMDFRNESARAQEALQRETRKYKLIVIV